MSDHKRSAKKLKKLKSGIIEALKLDPDAVKSSTDGSISALIRAVHRAIIWAEFWDNRSSLLEKENEFLKTIKQGTLDKEKFIQQVRVITTGSVTSNYTMERVCQVLEEMGIVFRSSAGDPGDEDDEDTEDRIRDQMDEYCHPLNPPIYPSRKTRRPYRNT